MTWPALIVVALSLASCGTRDVAVVGTEASPFVLLLGPSHVATGAEMSQLATALEGETGLVFDVVAVSSHRAALTRASTDRFDAAILPLFDYLFAHQTYSGQAALKVVRGDGKQTYQGEILVRADADFKALSDLAGKKVAFVDRYSTSGFLFPAKLLVDAKVKVESMFAGSHAAALAALRDGSVDAAAVYVGANQEAGLRALAQTQEIPNEPVFFRKNLDPKLRKQFVDAVHRLAKYPNHRKLLGSFADITGFVPVDDAAYADVHKVIEAVGNSIEDLVPAGWRIRHENDRSLLGDFAL